MSLNVLNAHTIYLAMFRYDVFQTWIKGCLHCHSSNSDGLLSPNDVVKYYKDRGYGLVAITDHEKITIVKKYSDVIVLPGAELSRGKGKIGSPYHLVILGIDDEYILKIRDPQEVIDYVNSLGGITIIAHPYWSGLVHEDLMNIDRYAGIEIYNTGCDLEVAKGFSTVHWDNLLSNGRLTWGYAVDDAHKYFFPPRDANGGWVWIAVNELSIESILNALRNGHFYSSMGPKIDELFISRRQIHVRSSPFHRVNIITANGKGMCIDEITLDQVVDIYRRGKLKGTFDEFEIVQEANITRVFLRHGGFKARIARTPDGIRELDIQFDFSKYDYIRIEIMDRKGMFAWTNPVNVHEL